MKIALYSRDGRAMSDGRLSRMFGKLEKESFDFYEISGGEDILPETDLVMSVGGDGTFLSASQCVGQSVLPILVDFFDSIDQVCNLCKHLCGLNCFNQFLCRNRRSSHQSFGSSGKLLQDEL